MPNLYRVAIDLDHFFILTDAGAPAGDRLVKLGLREGEPNDHPGQGTANRRFYLRNAMLELIYIRDSEEALNGPAAGLRLAERAAAPGASPFGIVVRHAPGADGDPFPGWRYQPEYFEDGVYFLVGDNAERIDEPLVICLPRVPPPHAPWPAPRAPFTAMTALRVDLPSAASSPVLDALETCDGLQLGRGRDHAMELTCGGGSAGRHSDLRPDLPLLIRW